MTKTEILSKYEEAVASFAAGLAAGSGLLDKQLEEEYKEQYELFKAGRDALRAQLAPNDPLTPEELREMNEKPAWCAELKCWGIIHIDSGGYWEGKPFLIGSWREVDFDYDIESRKLTLYRFPPEGSEG